MNMNLLAVLTPLSIYHGCSTRKVLWEVNITLGEFTNVSIKHLAVAILGNTERLIMVRITSPWTYR